MPRTIVLEARCPCCAQPLPAGIDWTAANVVSTGVGRIAIITCLVQREGLTTDQLIHLVWPGDPPEKRPDRLNVVHTSISRARRALREDGRWEIIGSGTDERPYKVRRVEDL